MKIEFNDFQNYGWLQKRRLRKIIYQWLADHFVEIRQARNQTLALDNINKYRLRIFPSTSYKKLYGNADFRTRNTGALSDMIPHEVVGYFQMDLFLVDIKNDLMFASDLMALTHGLGHVFLFCLDRTRRIKLTVDDASGNKKGTELNWYTAAVHNRTEAITKTVDNIDKPKMENEIYYLRTYRMFNRWMPVKYRVYDFRDDIRS